MERYSTFGCNYGSNIKLVFLQNWLFEYSIPSLFEFENIITGLIGQTAPSLFGYNVRIFINFLIRMLFFFLVQLPKFFEQLLSVELMSHINTPSISAMRIGLSSLLLKAECGAKATGINLLLPSPSHSY